MHVKLLKIHRIFFLIIMLSDISMLKHCLADGS